MPQQDSQKNKPSKLNLDKSKKFLGLDEMFYALNHDILTPKALGKSTPLPANEPLCEIEQPAGENYGNGTHYSQITNEAYSWHINNRDANYIMRVNGEGKCDIIYDNDINKCLRLSANPKHSIEDWRALLYVEKICANRDGKYLIWTNGKDDIGYLDTEASIATNSFTTPFFQRCVDDPCDFIRLCVPKPCGCLNAEYIPLPDNERSLSNQLLNVGLKFMYQHEYYDGRKSDWSDPSTLFFQDVGGCFDSGEGFPRCIKIRVPVGNPMVDKIHIAYNKNEVDNDNNDVWYRAEIVDKYKKYNNSQEKWYNRDIAELLNFSEDDCSFDYVFCNDKQCDVIDPKEISRVFNPIPREAQGLILIKNSLGFYNYKSGTCPVDKKEIEKFNVKLDCDTIKECKTEFSKVTVRAIIHNFAHGRNQFIWRDKEGAEDDLADVAKFGGLNPQLDGGLEEPMGYDQYFDNKVRNFIVYIEGTDYWGEMKQYHASSHFNNRELHGIVNGLSQNSEKRKWRKDVRHGNFFYQEYTFTVPKGTKGFIRMASHHAEGNEQSSSTFVVGVHNDLNEYSGDNLYGNALGGWNNMSVVDFTTEEIYFDTCDGDVDKPNAFIIQDNAVDKGLAKKASAYFGYVRDESGVGLEGLNIHMAIGFVGDIGSVGITDHNGFFHFYCENGIDGDVDIIVKAEIDCGEFKELKKITIPSEAGANTSVDLTIEKVDDEKYLTKSYALVKMNVNDCAGRGIGGIRVALSGSKWRDTDGSGEVEFKIRNYSTRARNVRAVVIDHNGCFNVDCDGKCSPCFPTQTGSTPSCFVVGETESIKVIQLPAVVLNKDAAVSDKKGLKRGGKYPFGVVVKGRCGRISAVYELPSIEIPRLQKDDKSSYCGFKYESTGMVLPDWAACIDIVRGQNLNPFELQWLVDKVERTNDGKLKLTIQSLNDYNESFFFKTNTKYQWLQGDRVEFIKNGDGKTFMAADHGLLNFLTVSPSFDKTQTDDPDAEQPADFFNQLLLDDDGKMDMLKEGALIEIQRSKECFTQPVYFGICASIPVENGQLVYPSGTFTTFDTYLVNRKIGKHAAQSFEHHSPSDFWGAHADDRGRAYFVNKYENEKRFDKSITICAPNQLNYFGDLVKTFDIESGITAMKVIDGKVILAICEYDSFIVRTADELVRVVNGVLTALPADAIISNPDAHLDGMFGCQYQDIGSILFGNGFATFVDSSRSAHVHHDFNRAEDVSLGKTKSYFKKRCYELVTHNKTAGDDYYNHYRWVTGQNTHNGAVYLTVKRLRDSGINNQPELYLQQHETLAYFPPTKDYLTFCSFVPEAYSQLHLHADVGCSMIQYFQGVPYFHQINATKWNEFFGAACDRFIGISTINTSPEKEKVAVAMELSDETMWFVVKVETDAPNYDSEIPPVKFEKSGRKWNAAYLGNKNSIDGLFGEDKPRGYFVAITLCRDNTDGLKYKTIDRNLQIKYDELDEILSKFTILEQSGFTDNL